MALSLPYPDHISPETSAFHHEDMHDSGQQTDPLKHMAGLVMGITILPPNGIPVARNPPKPERKLQLLIAKNRSNPKKYTYSVLETGHVTQTGGGPGPTLVLTPQSSSGDPHHEPTR